MDPLQSGIHTMNIMLYLVGEEFGIIGALTITHHCRLERAHIRFQLRSQLLQYDTRIFVISKSHSQTPVTVQVSTGILGKERLSLLD